MKANLSIKRIFRGIYRAIQLAILSFTLLLLLLILFLQLPPVKSYLAQKAVTYVADRTDHDIRLKGIRVAWLDNVVLEGFELYDQHDSLMARSGEVKVDFTISEFLRTRNLLLDDVSVKDAELNLVKYQNEDLFNLQTFIRSLSSDSSNKAKSNAIAIAYLELDDVAFKHRNLNDTTKKATFNANDFVFDIRSGFFTGIDLHADSLQLEILDFVATEVNSGFELKGLSSQVFMDPQHIGFKSLELKTPYSYVSDSLVLSFNSISDLSQFFTKVNLQGVMSGTQVSTKDLSFFSPISFDSTFNVDGNFSGTISNLILDRLKVATSSGSYIETSGSIIGLPDIRNSFLNLDVYQGSISAIDIENVVGSYSFGDNISVTANFSGFVSDFVAFGLFETDHGVIRSDLNFQFGESLSQISYNGVFELRDFDFGRVVKDTLIRNLDMTAQIRGKGIKAADANFFLDAGITDMTFNNYEYDSLQVVGQFKQNYYDGQIAVRDPNCQISGNTQVDLNDGRRKLKLSLKVDSTHLQELNWSKNQLDFSSALSLDIEGLNIDDLAGSISLGQAVLVNENGRLAVDSILFRSSRDDISHGYELSSPFLKGTISGDFLPSVVLKDLPVSVESFLSLLLRTDSVGRQSIVDISPTDKYNLQSDLQLVDVNPILTFLGLPVEISPDALFQAQFRKSKNFNMSFFFESDSSSFSGNKFKNNVFEINASRELNSEDVLAVIQLTSDEQSVGDILTTEDFFLESVWFNNTVDSRLLLEQKQFENSLTLNSVLKYTEDSVIFKMKPSEILIVGETWDIEEKNEIIFNNGIVYLQNLLFPNKDQSVGFGGFYSPQDNSEINFDLQSFDLENLNVFLKGKELGGVLNWQGTLKRDSLGGQMQLESNLTIDSLTYNGFDIGHIEGITSWNDLSRLADFNLDLTREEVNTISIEGSLDPYATYDQLSVDVTFDDARLQLVEPFVGTIFQDIGGKIGGAIKVTGPLQSPVFSGEATVKNGQLTFGYTNTTYLVDGAFSIDSYEISFEGIDIKDNSNGRGKLFGSIYHENLRNLQMNFFVNFDRMQLLNTTAVDNDIYYGRAYGSGSFNLSGSPRNLTVDAKITSRQGTNIFFPLNTSSSIAANDFITFLQSESDSIQTANPNPIRINTDGLTLNMDLNVTSDAYAELIFDAQSGDIIRGRANGDLQFRMSPTGDLSLRGGLEIENGAYNFTVPGLNKEFVLRRGGTINWSGDPFQGEIDLEATYRQIADLNDWDQTGTSSNVPLLVVLDLNGAMLKPDISFHIEAAQDVTSLPGGDDQGRLRRFLVTTNDREDELNKQVFSLLMLRKLSPEASFNLGTVDRGIGSSVSELLSNQLSYWLSQSNENLEIDIDLNSFDENSFNTFQYRLAYSFLDGRLRISGGNNLNNNLNNNASNNSIAESNNALIGNWAVEYLLTEDGRLRVKLFSRANQFLSAASESNQQTGISLQLIRSFDQFKELVSKNQEQSLSPSPATRRDEEDIESSSGN